MSKEKFSLQKITNIKDWDELLKSSCDKSIFNSYDYLKLIGSKYHLWLIKQGNEKKAGFYCAVSNDEKNIIHNDYLIYSGLIFNDINNTKIAKKNHQKFQITDFIANQLPVYYDNINFSLSPEIIDIRPFQWFNYNSNKKKYAIDVRFTSYLNLINFNPKEEFNNLLFNNMDSVRRYSIRDAIKTGYKFEKSNNVNQLINFYKFNMKNQGIIVKDDKIENMQKIMNFFIVLNKGSLFNVKNSDGEVLYSIFYIWDDTKAYYLFGSGGEKSMSWQASIATWEVIKYLYSKNITLVDLEGVNSPKRGWFKQSFGGTLKSYFNISI
ncbi:hypothetical protein N9E50_03065 [Alphaproteobacteria bacterium]|nr:hypothetical protein [Alphaproteobacteria bacterium]